MLKIDFHVHSSASYDCEMSIDEIVKQARINDIQIICITDHSKLGVNTGFHDDIFIVAGEEIKTQDGEISGLYLKNEVPPGLSPLETIRQIKDQCGLVYIPHPFDIYRKGRIAYNTLLEIIDTVDIIEAGNSKSLTPLEFYIARFFAEKHNKVISAGSDAHYRHDIGSSHVIFESDTIPVTAETMLQLFRGSYRLVTNRKKLIPRVFKKLTGLWTAI